MDIDKAEADLNKEIAEQNKHPLDSFKEFDEFDLREEPNLATKNVMYTFLSNAHYQRKRHLDKEFGTSSVRLENSRDSHSNSSYEDHSE